MGASFLARQRGRTRVLLVALLGAVLVSGFVLGRTVWAAEPQQHRGPAERITSAEVAARTAPLANLETAFEAISDKMDPSVVSIRVSKTVKTTAMDMPEMGQLFRDFPGFQGQMPQFQTQPRQYSVRGMGSGVIVRSDGWILTNDHVAGDADKVTVRLSDGRELPGTVRRDFRSDLALVKVNASNLVPAELGDSDRVHVGQWAVAFGSPFELQNTMTLGIISARARQEEVGGGNDARAYTNLLQTDAAINPGNSGGPLVDIDGRVIGINVAIESPSGGSVGIGFAIPINTAKYVMSQLIEHGKVTRGFLGVVPRALNYNERAQAHVSEGAMVESVSDGTPAAKAGFQPGDVVVRFNGQPVRDDIAFRDMVAKVAPGARVDAVVRRNGRDVTLTPTLEAAPDLQTAMQNAQDEQSGGKLGVRVQALTPDAAKQYNLGTNISGVIVTQVRSGSAAEDAGLQPGDVIMSANERPVRSGEDLAAAVQSARSGDTVNLVVYRQKARTLVSVRIP